MTPHIWRVGDEPLAPGTRVRALDIPGVPDAVGLEGDVIQKGHPQWGCAVDFGNQIENEDGDPASWWFVERLEVLPVGPPIDERIAKLERFAALAGPVISMTDILSMLRAEGRISADERFEIVELADELGVGAK